MTGWGHSLTRRRWVTLHAPPPFIPQLHLHPSLQNSTCALKQWQDCYCRSLPFSENISVDTQLPWNLKVKRHLRIFWSLFLNSHYWYNWAGERNIQRHFRAQLTLTLCGADALHSPVKNLPFVELRWFVELRAEAGACHISVNPTLLTSAF